MATKTVEYDCACPSCKGTGLYVGFAEKDGAAVVCNNCGGKGWSHVKHTYETTDKIRKSRKGVKRVFQTNPGIGVGKSSTERKFELSDFGGMPYKEEKFAGACLSLGLMCHSIRPGDVEKVKKWVEVAKQEKS